MELTTRRRNCDISRIDSLCRRNDSGGKEGLGSGKAMASKALLALVAWSMLCSVLVQAQDFDFFYFVQQWPGSYCDSEKGCCFALTGVPKAVFGIHGLWPNYNDGTYPQSCGQDAFHPEKVHDLLQEMDDDWGSLACPSSDSEQFWEHEWTKHGTCSGLDEHKYFKSALDLYSKYNITAALADAGIVPDGSSYKMEDIRSAISKVLDGHLPGVDCNKDTNHNKQIYEVYICVDKDGFTLIDCPVFPNNECQGEVEFPAFDPSSTSGAETDSHSGRHEESDGETESHSWRHEDSGESSADDESESRHGRHKHKHYEHAYESRDEL